MSELTELMTRDHWRDAVTCRDTWPTSTCGRIETGSWNRWPLSVRGSAQGKGLRAAPSG